MKKPSPGHPAGFSTRAIHEGYDPASHHGSLNLLVYLNATYSFDSIAQGQQRFAGEVPSYVYARVGNPTQSVMKKRLASLESGEAELGSSIGHRGYDAGVRFMDALQLAQRAVSLEDAERLVQHPASMTHNNYTDVEREAHGISLGLVRISVGLENAEDLSADIMQALDHATG